MPNIIIPYDPELKLLAGQLRKNSTLAEVLLWKNIRKKALGVEFHPQVPMLSYIVDFYCHEIGLAIEIDGPIHDFNYFYDVQRQDKIEAYGVEFLRFTNDEVKNNLFSALLVIREKVDTLLQERTGRKV